jgi:cell division protein FtsW (lipid II flippase)
LVATSPRSARSAEQVELILLGLACAFLGLTCLALTVAPMVRPGATSADAAFTHWLVMPMWLAAALLGRGVLRRRLPRHDPLLFPLAMLLAGWGVLLIWRLTPSFGLRQLAWLGVSTLAMLGLAFTPRRLDWLRSYRYLWLALGLLLTGMTLLFGTHPSGGSPRLWLGCCGVYFQPSEMLRLLLVVFFASYLSDRVKFGWRRDRPSLFATTIPLLVVWGASTLLVLAQRDLGSGMVLLALLTALLYLASGRWEIILVGALLAVAAAGAAAFASSVVQARLSAWVNPWQDPLGGSYQIVQALIALASGGVLGSGPGLGSPGYVPVAHSDFIFVSIGEEWGMAGALALLALLAVLVGRGLRIGVNATDPFRQLLAGGLAVNLGLQTVFILAGVLRLLPLTGITLPFVSYGGTSLLSSFLSLGLLLILSDSGDGPPQPKPTFETVFIGFQVAFLLLAAASVYWMVVRAPAILSRTDNLRRVADERYSQRGRILDRNGVVLAESVGFPGAFERRYPAPVAGAVVGFDSPVYGLMGIEQSMDAELRGESGAPFLKLALNQLLYGYPPSGADVRLTLDVELQAEAAAALEGSRGAIVVLDPTSGDVLAQASSPTFDPATLEVDWADLIADPGAPLLNRAVQAAYQPGLAIAPWLVAWALDKGQATLDQAAPAVDAPIQLNGLRLTCARPPAGATLGDALRAACPTPLAALGRQMGAAGLQAAVAALDLGWESQTAGGGEAPPEPVEALAVGQGSLTFNPLTMARAWAAASGGRLPSIHIVDAVSGTTDDWRDWPALAEEQSVFGQATAQAISGVLTKPGEEDPLFSAKAIVSAQGDQVAWYLARAGDATAPVVVVVLEASDLQSAERAGGRMLDAVKSRRSP